MDRIIIESKIQQISLPGVKGMMTFLAHHMPILSQLASGQVTILLDDAVGSAKNFSISGGFVEMKNNECRVFVNDVN